MGNLRGEIYIVMFLMLSGTFAFGGLPGVPMMSRNPCDSGSIQVGAQCGTDGPYYIGTLSDINESRRFMITPQGCTDSTTPVCNGSADTVAKPWGPNGESAIEGLPDVNSRGTLGDRLEQEQVVGGAPSHEAIAYCTNMAFGGYSDWRLPTATEMAQIYCRWQTGTTLDDQPAEGGVALGGCGGHLAGAVTDLAGIGFDSNSSYWVANEDMTTYDGEAERTKSYVQNFATGGQASINRTTSFKVRCVRDF